MRLAVVIAVAGGCYTGGATATTPAPTAVALAPACAPTLELDAETATGRALVDGTDLQLAVDHEEGKADGEAVVYPRDAHSVLFAWTIHGHDGRPNGSRTLYTVDCTTKRATEFTHDPDGDYGHSVLSRDGKALYYSAAGSVAVLDLATKRHRPLVAQPAVLHACGDRDADGPHDRIALAAVKGYAPAGTAADDDDTLIYEVGDNCGFEGDWDATTLYLDHPERPGGKPYAPRPVAVVAADAGGAIYATAGGTCDAPALWRSDDRGEHWAAIALPKPERGEDESGPVAIVADAKRPGAVLVELAHCEGPRIAPGRILVTRDRGATWDALPAVPGAEAVTDIPVDLAGGSIDRPLVWRPHADGQWDPVIRADTLGPDGTWVAVVPSPPAPAPIASGTAAARGDVYQATSNGLLRKHAGEPPRRLFPH